MSEHLVTGFQVESSTPATCANAACVKSNPPNKWSMHYRDIDLQECITNCNVLNVGGNCDFLTYTRNVSYWNCFLIRSISGDGGKQDIENGCAKQRAQQRSTGKACVLPMGEILRNSRPSRFQTTLALENSSTLTAV